MPQVAHQLFRRIGPMQQHRARPVAALAQRFNHVGQVALVRV